MAKNNEKSVLKSWLFYQPLKFAALAVALMIGVAGLYSMVATFAFNAAVSTTMMFTLLLACLVFAGCKLIRWLPADNLDRRSFVAVGNGLTMAGFGTLMLMSAFVLANMQRIMFYMTWLQSASTLLFFIVATAVSTIYMYLIGLVITNTYATYRRAIGMGIARWKVLLSLPFVFTLLWLPGFFLNDEKAKPVVPVRAEWYSDFTDWVVAQPLGAIGMWAFTIFIISFFVDIHSACLMLLCGAYFGIWALVMGAQKLRKNIGGLYSSVAVVINLALVVSIICGIAFFKPRAKIENIQIETIQIADTL